MSKRARDAAISNARGALQRGDAQAAEAHCRSALAVDNNDATALTLLGTALRHRDPAHAEEAFRRALAHDAANVDAAFHLANLLRAQARHAEAIPLYRQILVRVPAHPSVLNNLGMALAADGQSHEAEAVFRQALKRDPHHEQSLMNLAHVLCARKQYEEALAIGARYVQRYGDAPAELWIDIGVSQHALRDYDAAVTSLRRALALSPHDGIALLDLGSVMVDMADFVAADPVLRDALTASPDNVHARSLLSHARQHLCAWDGLDALHAGVLDALTGDAHVRVNPFFLLSMPSTALVQQQAARRWAADVAPATTLPPPIIRNRGTRLRVGYLSSDFRAHAMAFLLTEVWERHDRTQLETFAYALAPPDGSATGVRIEAAFDTFVDCSAQSSDAVARRVRDDAIDVLIDLNGYTTHSRSDIAAARPAAVQMQWLGYLGTMGAPWIDHVLTDAYVTPSAMQPYFDERFLYLPDCYCPSDTRRGIAPQRPTRAQCGLPDSGLVLCCFNNPYKLLPQMFDIWMRVLAAAPDGVLWLSPASDVARANLEREAQKRGVDATRLVFAPRVPIAQHLARHVHADLYLDTTPYNAGTAANDALLMGVPVLTCSGETMASRVAGSQLHAIGLPELVTHDLSAYEAQALELARHHDRLRDLRATLEKNRARHPLFDMARFTRALDDLLLGAATGR